MPHSPFFRTSLCGAALICILTSSCAWLNEGRVSSYPRDLQDSRRDRIGSMAGEDGLILFGKKKKTGGGNTGAAGAGIGVNSHVWRATLDTLRFMPLQSADPFGGVIITDWYEDPEAQGERFKVNAFITSKELRADAVNISLFRQIKKHGEWKDSVTSKDAASDIESRIITRAKRLHAAATQ